MLKILMTALAAFMIAWLLGPVMIPILARLKPAKVERDIAPEPPPQPTKKKQAPANVAHLGGFRKEDLSTPAFLRREKSRDTANVLTVAAFVDHCRAHVTEFSIPGMALPEPGGLGPAGA